MINLNKKEKLVASEKSINIMDSYSNPEVDNELPTVVEVFDNFLNMGSQSRKLGKVLEFPLDDLIIEVAGQSAVKSLKVNVISTESQDIAILHDLHNKTRNNF